MRSAPRPPKIMEFAPLLPVAGGLILGIGLDRTIGFQGAAYWLLLAAATALAALRAARTKGLPLLAFVAAAGVGGIAHHASQIVPPDSIELLAAGHGPPCRVRGTVIREPQIKDSPSGPFEQWITRSERTSFVLQVRAVETPRGFVPATGKLWITAYEALLDLRAGSEVEVFGRLHPLRPPQNPGSFDWASFARAQGIVARITCQHRDAVARLSGDRSGRPLLDAYRAIVAQLLTDHLPPEDEEATLLQSMLLGQRSSLADRLNAIFLASGCLHFLAVSGVNVAIVMSLAYGACRLIGVRRHACTVVMIVAVVGYTLLAEPRPPILRAAIIGLMYCAARLLNRDSSYLNWISASAIILLIANPLSLFDVGFQLSFVAVLGVSYLAPAMRNAAHEGLLRLRTPKGVQFAESDREIIKRVARLQKHRSPFAHVLAPLAWTWRKSFEGLIVGIAAWGMTLPLTAFHFYRVQPWGAINSVIVAPFVAAVMGLGFAKVALGIISPTLGGVVGMLLTGVDALMLRIVEWMSVMPGASIWTAPPTHIGTAAFYLLALAFVLRFAHRPKSAETGEERAKVAPVAMRLLPRYATRASFGLSLLAAPLWMWSTQEPPALRVTVLAVGRGSTTVIELPEGQTVLYDVGSSYASDVSETVLLPSLRSKGIRRIDRIYISHPNLDHFSGLPGLLEEMPGVPVAINDLFDEHSRPNSPSRHLLDLLALGGHELEAIGASAGNTARLGASTAGMARPTDALVRESVLAPTWTFGGADFEVLSPLPADKFATANDTSTVMRISYRGHSILFTGDIDEGAQRALLARGDLQADVLLLPHHGSVRSTTREFLQAVDADYFIRSSNERMEDTINGLPQIIDDAKLYNTADDGAITVTFDMHGVSVGPHMRSR